MKVDLYSQIKDKDKDINLKDFRDSLMDLFREMLKANISNEYKNKIARIRAYVDIKLKNL